jgi:hypothetical protein
MYAVLIIILFITFFLYVFVGSSIALNKHKWKYYKPVYQSLNKDDWYKIMDQYWNKNNENQIYFAYNGSIMLAEGIYFHPENWSVTFLDPYTCYWYFKYKRWFKKNVLC